MFATKAKHPLDFLTLEDYQELKSSGLTDEQILTCGHFSIEKPDGKRLGLHHKGLVFRYLDPVSGKPYLTPQGKPFHRMKPRDWEETWTNPVESPHKYLSPKEGGNKPYWSPLLQHFNHLAKKPKFDLDITEGEKKADALAAHGVFCVGLAGVNGWLDKEKRLDEIDIPPAQLIEDDEQALKEIEDKLPQSRMIPELKEALEWQYRRINIVFDSDSNSKRQVRGAVKDLAEALAELNAEPYIVRLPNEVDGSKNGVDDFIVRHGLDAYNFLRKIAKPAFKKQKFHFPKEPTQYEKIIMAWSVMKDAWRYRPGIGWYNWTGTHWVSRTTAEFQESVTAFQDAQGWEFPVGKDLMLYQLQSRMLVRDDRWNPSDFLGFSNGTLDCKTNTFSEGHQRENFLTAILPYEYSPLANCPTWLKFLNEALQSDQEVINLLQAFIKWVLLPKPRERKAEIEKCLDLVGPKGSGKGTFLDTLISLVGEGNTGAIGTETFKSSNHLSGLLDKKLSVDTDAFGYLANVGLFNKVVSNEPVLVKLLYKDPISTRLGTVIVRAYNRVLEVPDGSEGLDRRIIAVGFNHQPEVIDLELSDKLQQELPGIFAWAWQLSTAEMKKRLIWAGACSNVQEAALKRFEANNPEYSFLAETFPRGNEWAKAGDLYQSYVDWCKAAGVSPKKLRKFSEAIQGLGATKSHKTDGCFFYRIPVMDEFDVVDHLGLKKKIAQKKSLEKSSLSSLSQSQQDFNCPSTVPDNCPSTPSIVPETPICDKVLAGLRECMTYTEYQDICRSHGQETINQLWEELEQEHKDRIYALAHGFHQSRDNQGQSQGQSQGQLNVDTARLRDNRDDSAQLFSGGDETTSIQESKSWTKTLFAAIKEKPVIEFPSVGCEVGKQIEGQRKNGWRGYIREVLDGDGDGDRVRVWWIGDYQLNRNGKPIKDKNGKPEEKLTIEPIANLYPITSKGEG